MTIKILELDDENHVAMIINGIERRFTKADAIKFLLANSSDLRDDIDDKYIDTLVDNMWK